MLLDDIKNHWYKKKKTTEKPSNPFYQLPLFLLSVENFQIFQITD